MTIALNQESKKTEIFYPISDGEPIAESYDHMEAMSMTLMVLKMYLKGQRATVLANQFFYYEEGKPESRTTPDAMVIFDVEPGGRDCYKVWEEGAVPKVLFEITSASTENEDKNRKKHLYEQIGVEEYWLFDPRKEWIKTQLLGYRLKDGVYEEIKDGRSEPLKLDLKVEKKLIRFYREDTGQKLLYPDELADKFRELKPETLAIQELEKERELAAKNYERAKQERKLAEKKVKELEEKLARSKAIAPATYQKINPTYLRSEVNG